MTYTRIFGGYMSMMTNSTAVESDLGHGRTKVQALV